ncbi:MAG: allantoicase [Alphaproteobacteria bacterium]|nr:MAG: allantoicase [Alphaproteobacteria bacterium]
MTETLPDFAIHNINLASTRLGAETLSCSDDFFAPMHRMLKEEPPVFIADKYDDHGKWMDGWESRRRRGPGHDWCVMRLGVPGVVSGILVDTAHFTGNFPPAASLEGAFCEGTPDAETRWHDLTGRIDLQGNNKHWLPVESDKVCTHLRLNMLNDGGIARFQAYGTPAIDWQPRIDSGEEVNLAAMELGARAVAWTDAHYGDPNKMLAPRDGLNMGDGWETRRRREPGNDWLILRLAHPGIIERAVVDTKFFKGNYPDRCSMEVIDWPLLTSEDVQKGNVPWEEVLNPVKLEADRQHEFMMNKTRKATYLRLHIYPDGGVSRLRLFGKPVTP